jgi:hypothetical protein
MLNRFRCETCGVLWLTTKEFQNFFGLCPRRGCGAPLSSLDGDDGEPSCACGDDGNAPVSSGESEESRNACMQLPSPVPETAPLL